MTASLAGVVPAIVDAHIHQWDPFTTPREASRLARVHRRAPRLFERAMPLLVSQDKRDMVRTAAHVARRYLPETYAADAASVVAEVGVPVESVVHVQAGWNGDPVDETRWVASLPFGQDGTPALAAVVAEADPRDPRVGEVLDAHAAASDRFRGIRFIGSWHPDRRVVRWQDQPGLFRAPAFLAGFAAVAERGLTFDAYLYSHQLDDVAVLAKEFPETTIVLDHYGPPVGWLGPMGRSVGRTPAARDRLLQEWQAGVAELATRPNVVAKHSGLAFPMHGMATAPLSRQRIAELMAPLVEHTTDVFGADRLLFGSNFPMDKALATLGDVAGALVDVLAPRGEGLLRGVFRENATRVYSL